MPLLLYAEKNFDRGLDAYLAGEYQQAYDIWKSLAEGGDQVAMFNIGVLHAEGRGVAKDMRQAADWYRRAAEAGYAPAQFNLGSAYFEGQGVAADKRQAFQWWTKAAAQNHAQSLFNLATLYLQGDGVAPDQAKALALYRRAASQGDERAKKVVTQLTQSAAAVSRAPKSTEAAAPIAEGGPPRTPAPAADDDVESARAADPTVTASGGRLKTAGMQAPGSARREPWIQSQDPQHVTIQLAVYSDEQQLQQFIAKHRLTGQPVAYFRVRKGTRYHYKLIYGAFKSVQNAKAARDALPEVVKKQKPWIRPFGAVHAELTEPTPPESDSNPPRTGPNEASVTETKQIAAVGDERQRDSGARAEDAQLRKGQAAFNSQDYAKALEIWRPLAVRGLPAAQYNLGFMYESGWGVGRSDQEAAGWYQFAADQGHAKAQFNLGRLYMEGRGVEKNKGLGLYWIQNAADRDDKRAVDYLKAYQARH